MTELQPSRGFEWTQAPWGPALRCRPLAEVARHLFTVGNLQLREDPLEWRGVEQAIGVDEGAVLLLRQVHGETVAVARQSDRAPWTRPDADAVVSDDRRVAIGVRVADCASILIADRRRPAVAAVHAGWRGTVQRVAQAAVGSLEAEFGSKPDDLLAAIGPCLGPCCGEVGPEVVEAFRAAGHASRELDRWFAPGDSGRPYLNLPGANHDQLVAAGIPPDSVFAADLCTRSHPDQFHSYRAAGSQAGRMLAVIRATA